ncbi:MAG: hypothetical protein C0621_08265 [Desulfuromonas sp.]|nr:MAG: hypothetical protein C0621_08265 [Desulfuromonas sp.]
MRCFILLERAHRRATPPTGFRPVGGVLSLRGRVALCLGLLLLIISTAGLPLVAAASGEKRLVRVGAFDYFPGIFLNEEGRVDGFYTEMLAALAKEQNWEVRYVYGSWAEGLERLQRGEVDLLTSVAWTEERAQSMDYVPTPLLTVWGELYVREGLPIDSLLEIAGHRVGVMRRDFNGASFVKLIKKFDIDCTIVEYPGFSEIFAATESGEIDAGVVNNTFGAAMQHEYRIKSSGVVFNPFEIFFAVKKGRHAELVSTLDSTLTHWRSEEHSPYQRARQKWMHRTTAVVKVIPDWVRYLIQGAVVVFLLGGGFIVVLRWQVKQRTAEIHEKKARLRESQEHYLSLFDNAPAPMWELDLSPFAPSGEKGAETVTIRDVNRSAVLLCGGKSKEEVVTAATRLFPFEEQDLLQGAVQSLQAGEPFYQAEGELSSLTGKRLHVFSRWQLLPGHEESLDRVLVSTIDITRRTQMENALRLLVEGTVEATGEAFFASLVEHLAQVFSVGHVLVSRLLPGGEEFQTLAVCQHGRVLDNLVYLVKGTPCEEALLHGVKHVRTGVADAFPEDPILREMGVEGYLGVALYDRLGLPTGILCILDENPILSDENLINMLRLFGGRASAELERLMAQEELQERDQLLREVQKIAGVASFRWDFTSDLLIWNGTLSGISAPLKETGEEFQSLIHPKDQAIFNRYLETVRAGDEEAFCEFRIRLESGELLPVASRARLRVDHRQRAKGVIGYLQDIREMKKTEALLEKARDDAESASRAKSSFLANMSHEFRTPLNGILGMLELLEEGSLDSEQREFVQLSRQAGKSLLSLVSEILDLSRIEAGQLVLDGHPFTLASALKEVGDFFTHVARQKGITLSVEREGSLPEMIFADEHRLRQILLNLLGNAVKFTDEGGVTLKVSLACNLSQEGVRFTVSDTGPGISAEILPAVFQPFVQGDATYRKKYQGAGLGLSIVRQLVDLMKGEVWVEKSDAHGTTIIVELPLNEVTEGEKKSASGCEPHPPLVAGRRALLAEDNHVNQILFAKLLERFGFETLLANNGEEALALLREQAVDLVLMDIQMPVMDGMEATRRIRADEKKRGASPLPIIALTAYTQQEDLGLFREAGVDDILVKPVRLGELKSRITRFFV